VRKAMVSKIESLRKKKGLNIRERNKHPKSTTKLACTLIIFNAGYYVKKPGNSCLKLHILKHPYASMCDSLQNS
jgi:hypothetical protein